MGLQPRRDGAMENDIVVHEMTHGITNRMTGGGTGRCLQSTEAAGLGEGWSDAMAEYVAHVYASTWILTHIQLDAAKEYNNHGLCDWTVCDRK